MENMLHIHHQPASGEEAHGYTESLEGQQLCEVIGTVSSYGTVVFFIFFFDFDFVLSGFGRVLMAFIIKVVNSEHPIVFPFSVCFLS